MGTAFPGLVGCFLALGEDDDLGMVVGWAEGYLVYATADAKLDRVLWSDPRLRLTGRGQFTDGDVTIVRAAVASA